MRIRNSVDVQSDLDDIAAYIALDNPRRAATFLKEIRQEIVQIGRNPYLFQLRPDLGTKSRVATVGRYLIIFFIEDEQTVRIQRVVHGNRVLPHLLH